MRSKTKYIIIHCSATDDSEDIGAKEIDRWHRARGWLKIGYHKVIRRDGTIEDGRDINEPGAHAKGYNSISIGICLVGGVEADLGDAAVDNFTLEQKDALRELLFDLQAEYPEAEIIGHYQVNKHKACPCFDVPAFVQDMFTAVC